MEVAVLGYLGTANKLFQVRYSLAPETPFPTKAINGGPEWLGRSLSFFPLRKYQLFKAD